MNATNKTVVVHRNKHHFDVLIDRTSKWGNPYGKDYILTEDDSKYLGKPMKAGSVATRSERINLYERYLRNNDELMSDIESLRGKRIACWCKPDKSCHGDIIVKILNELEIEKMIGE